MGGSNADALFCASPPALLALHHHCLRAAAVEGGGAHTAQLLVLLALEALSSIEPMKALLRLNSAYTKEGANDLCAGRAALATLQRAAAGSRRCVGDDAEPSR